MTTPHSQKRDFEAMPWTEAEVKLVGGVLKQDGWLQASCAGGNCAEILKTRDGFLLRSSLSPENVARFDKTEKAGLLELLTKL